MVKPCRLLRYSHSMRQTHRIVTDYAWYITRVAHPSFHRDRQQSSHLLIAPSSSLQIQFKPTESYRLEPDDQDDLWTIKVYACNMNRIVVFLKVVSTQTVQLTCHITCDLRLSSQVAAAGRALDTIDETCQTADGKAEVCHGSRFWVL